MTEHDFNEKLPLIVGWIQRTLDEHASNALAVASLKFKRLHLYFSPQVLAKAQVVYVSRVPVPPLTKLGLAEFSDFEQMNPAGITYMDTFFSQKEMQGRDDHHFHELVHVIQWRVLGPRGFLMAYADGLSKCGYYECPLEVMAYTLEGVFRSSESPFDVERVVREEVRRLYS